MPMQELITKIACAIRGKKQVLVRNRPFLWNLVPDTTYLLHASSPLPKMNKYPFDSLLFKTTHLLYDVNEDWGQWPYVITNKCLGKLFIKFKGNIICNILVLIEINTKEMWLPYGKLLFLETVQEASREVKPSQQVSDFEKKSRRD